MIGSDASSGNRWTGVNRALAIGCGLTLVGAIEVFLFGVVWTHGVYGSRMAWLMGVVLPLLAITAGLAWAAATYGVKASTPGERDRRRSGAKGVGVVALALIGIPFAFAGLLLLSYALAFIVHELH